MPVKKTDGVDDPRRTFLITLLSTGALAATALRPVLAGLLGKVPAQLPAGKSVYTLEGDVRVNGNAATGDTVIRARDLVETGAGGRLIFVVGKDAFLLRGGGNLQLNAGSGEFVLKGLRLLTGQLLSVFGKTEHRIDTATATIGIRGTGVYVESASEQSYVCTCYGVTDLAAADDPGSRETIHSRHHDAPRYILASGASGSRIRPAPFKNHTDEELELIEALVGRAPPFLLPGDGYAAPRRSGY